MIWSGANLIDYLVTHFHDALMARPKSDDKRNAIMEAAILVIVSQGLSAPTATIAKEAGISNGSLFTYFATKADLFNQLYLDIKMGMIADAMKDLPEAGDFRAQLLQAWSNWMDWVVSNPEKRRAMEQLNVSADITQETRAIANEAAGDLNDLMDQIRAHGSLKTAPLSFVGALINGLIEATLISMNADPAHAKRHRDLGFETLWRAIS